MLRRREEKHISKQAAAPQEEQKLECCDFILQNEKKIHTRATVI